MGSGPRQECMLLWVSVFFPIGSLSSLIITARASVVSGGISRVSGSGRDVLIIIENH